MFQDNIIDVPHVLAQVTGFMIRDSIYYTILQDSGTIRLLTIFFGLLWHNSYIYPLQPAVWIGLDSFIPLRCRDHWRYHFIIIDYLISGTDTTPSSSINIHLDIPNNLHSLITYIAYLDIHLQIPSTVLDILGLAVHSYQISSIYSVNQLNNVDDTFPHQTATIQKIYRQNQYYSLIHTSLYRSTHVNFFGRAASTLCAHFRSSQTDF